VVAHIFARLVSPKNKTIAFIALILLIIKKKRIKKNVAYAKILYPCIDVNKIKIDKFFITNIC
jgi:hypothetical protein